MIEADGPDDARERARVAIEAALAEAARRALAEGATPEALIRYAQERLRELRHGGDEAEPDESVRHDDRGEDGPDGTDELG
jgi:hypothetical protein